MKKILFLLLFADTGFASKGQNITAHTPDELSAGNMSPEKKITGSFEVNYQRHYLWRGIAFGNDDVAQPELALTYKNFTLTLCQNFNYRPSRVPKEYYSKNTFFDEQDVSLTYSAQWAQFNTEASVMAYFYFYQPTSPSTAELYNHSAYIISKKFSIFTENSLDIASYAGAIYNNNGIKYQDSFKKGLVLEWAFYAGLANAKFNRAYFLTDTGGLNLLGSFIDLRKNFGNFFAAFNLEKNLYVNGKIKATTGMKGTDNFIITAGIIF